MPARPGAEVTGFANGVRSLPPEFIQASDQSWSRQVTQGQKFPPAVPPGPRTRRRQFQPLGRARPRKRALGIGLATRRLWAPSRDLRGALTARPFGLQWAGAPTRPGNSWRREGYRGPGIRLIPWRSLASRAFKSEWCRRRGHCFCRAHPTLAHSRVVSRLLLSSCP